MIDLDQINRSAAMRHYMLANTPRYLYRHLREDPSVEAFAKLSTPKELVAAIIRIEKQPERSAEDISLAYVMLVALSFQDYRDVTAALSGWRPQVLRWATHIISILNRPSLATTIAHVAAPTSRAIAYSALPVEPRQLP
jgi:hypothetical protein